jgi:TRAP-type C4-dicarboxylate transport system permease large subunit
MGLAICETFTYIALALEKRVLVHQLTARSVLRTAGDISMTHVPGEAATQGPRFLGRTPTEWLVSLPTIAMLLLVLVISTGELIHGRLLSTGEALFGDKAQGVQYYGLRADPVRPECNPNMDIEAELARIVSAKPKGGGDAVDALFEDEKVDPEKTRNSLRTSLAECKEKHAWYEKSKGFVTPGVRAFRTVETSFFGLFRFGTEHRSMILLILMGVVILATTVEYEHIGLVPVRYKRDYLMQSLTTLGAGAMMLYSSVSYYSIASKAGVAMERPEHQIAWTVMFAAMTLLSLWQLFNQPKHDADVEEGTWSHALQSSPIAGTMAIWAGVYFLFNNHPSGLAIYINTLMEVPTVPLQLALFIWGGMLFKQSRMIDLFMNLLRPWKFSPEMLTFLVLLGAAVPTAYTGGSGAFVMAAGAIIYHEVRAVGGSSQFALGATAMAGSLGVVLRPSLLVVAIVAVNKEVTSSELFHWGLWVFALTSTLFFAASQMRREKHTVNVASPMVAIPMMLRQIPPILPHIAVVAAVILFYQYGLKASLNENTAPTIMPVIMLLIVAADKIMQARGIGQPDASLLSPFTMEREEKVESAIRVATNETVGHLGGYMFLILLSQAMGGVIERSGIVSLAPEQFSSPAMCMLFLTTALVFLGMFMEPLGAIFLVSGTLAPMAYHNGIDPVHFWVMVLMSFEVGYLMPPVALNQLLARQVVGDKLIDEADKEVAHLSFYRRYERWVLPNAVMTVGLIIVAYAPLVTRNYPALHQWLNGWMGFVAK